MLLWAIRSMACSSGYRLSGCAITLLKQTMMSLWDSIHYWKSCNLHQGHPSGKVLSGGAWMLAQQLINYSEEYLQSETQRIRMQISHSNCSNSLHTLQVFSTYYHSIWWEQWYPRPQRECVQMRIKYFIFLLHFIPHSAWAFGYLLQVHNLYMTRESSNGMSVTLHCFASSQWTPVTCIACTRTYWRRGRYSLAMQMSSLCWCICSGTCVLDFQSQTALYVGNVKRGRSHGTFGGIHALRRAQPFPLGGIEIQTWMSIITWILLLALGGWCLVIVSLCLF